MANVVRLPALVIVSLLINSDLPAQNGEGVDDSIRDHLVASVVNILTDSTPPVDRFVLNDKVSKAKARLVQQLLKSLSRFEEGGEREDSIAVFWSHANAVLWKRYVQTTQFETFIRRLVTTTTISQSHIHKVRDTYKKWINKPTTANFQRFSTILNETGRNYEVLCRISGKVDGTHYQAVTVAQSEVSELTTRWKLVPVGNYLIWKGPYSIRTSGDATFDFFIEKRKKLEHMQPTTVRR